MKINVFVRCPKCKKRHPDKTRNGQPTGTQQAKCPDHPSATPSWLVEQSSTVAGRTKRSYATFKTQTDAESHRVKLQAVAEGHLATSGEPAKIPFGRAVTDWVESKTGLGYNTLKGYRHTARTIAAHPIGAKPLGKVTRADLRSLYGEWFQDLKEATIRARAAVITGCLSEAHAGGIIATNPSHKALEVPKDLDMSDEGPKSWTEEETARFKVEAAEHRMYSLWMTILATGMRKAEALAIEVDDIDFEARTIRISKQVLNASKGEFVLGRPKTGKTRIARFGPQTAEILRSHIVAVTALRLRSEAWHTEHNFVFTPGGGLPWSTTNVTERFRKLCIKLGLPTIGVHGLRHTAATLLIEDGASMNEVKDHLGHADVSTTMNIYTHRGDDAQRATADRLDSIAIGS